MLVGFSCRHTMARHRSPPHSRWGCKKKKSGRGEGRGLGEIAIKRSPEERRVGWARAEKARRLNPEGSKSSQGGEGGGTEGGEGGRPKRRTDGGPLPPGTAFSDTQWGAQLRQKGEIKKKNLGGEGGKGKEGKLLDNEEGRGNREGGGSSACLSPGPLREGKYGSRGRAETTRPEEDLP